VGKSDVWTVTDDSGVKLICEITRLFQGQRLSCFVSGPDLSRAAQGSEKLGLQPLRLYRVSRYSPLVDEKPGV